MSSKTEEDKVMETEEKAIIQLEQEEDLREEMVWPFTLGDVKVPLMYFDLHSMPESIEDEESKTGQLLMALISEILYLKTVLSGVVQDRHREQQQQSFEEYLASQGKKLRGQR